MRVFQSSQLSEEIKVKIERFPWSFLVSSFKIQISDEGTGIITFEASPQLDGKIERYTIPFTEKK